MLALIVSSFTITVASGSIFWKPFCSFGDFKFRVILKKRNFCMLMNIAVSERKRKKNLRHEEVAYCRSFL